MSEYNSHLYNLHSISLFAFIFTHSLDNWFTSLVQSAIDAVNASSTCNLQKLVNLSSHTNINISACCRIGQISFRLICFQIKSECFNLKIPLIPCICWNGFFRSHFKHTQLVSVMESKKWSCDDEFDDHVIEEILQNCLEDVHSFLSIPVGEDAAQCYASLLQLSIVQFKIFMAKNSKVFKDATLLSQYVKWPEKRTCGIKS